MLRRSGLQNVRETLLVFLCEAIRRAFGRRRFQVVHVARFGLEFNHARADVIEQTHGQVVPLLCGDVFGVVREVADHFI